MITKQSTTLNRSFLWLNTTQFLGAANDNLFKGLMMFLLINRVGQDKASQISSTAALVFVVPFLLLTPYAGILADRFSKQRIIVLAKVAEVVLMALGVVSFWAGNPIFCYGVLFLMCAQSAFFGPSKYGIVPELVEPSRLSHANGLLEGWTYLAIVLGIGAAPALAELSGGNYALAGAGCILVAAAGLATSLGIKKTAASGGQGETASPLFVVDLYKTMRDIYPQRNLTAAVVAGAGFMFLAAFAQINLIPYGIQTCGLTEVHSGYLFVIAAVGIGLGSFLAGVISGRSMESGLIPLGSLLFSLGALGLSLEPALWMISVLIAVMGIGAGLYVVPVYAYIQLWGPRAILGRVVAASNCIGWMGVALAAGIAGLCSVLGMSAARLWIVPGVIGLAVFAVSLYYLREYVNRFVLAMLARAIYRLRVFGAENLPLTSGALLVANHISWADGLVLNAAQHRRIRFLIDREIYESKRLNPFFRFIRAIPISASDPPRQLVGSLQQARKAIEDGYLVCIFAEGALTRTGHLGAFRPGLEKIVKATDCPVIPVYLGGLWDSVACYRYGKLFSRFPRPLPYPVSVHFGEPMPADSTAQQIRQAVLELSCDWMECRKGWRLSLAQTFAKIARRNWKRPCIADAAGRSLTYGQTLTAAAAFADKYRKPLAGQYHIGILLPPSAGGAIANVAIGLLRKTAVNLNYTVSPADRQTAIDECGIQTILTSRLVLEKLGLKAEDANYLFLEDMAGSLTRLDKLCAAAKARIVPARLLGGWRRVDPDATAAILYSSGSSARPKGVMLSHHNLLSNVETAQMVYRFSRDVRLCGVLPFFHSFGLTCTMWLPMLAGVSAYYLPNPIDGKAVGQAIAEQRCTMLFSTPTFLLAYLRRCTKQQFASLQLIVAGAEKMKPSLADSFEQQFGIRPLEGYGATELSPLVSFNVPDIAIDGGVGRGTKAGSVGRPMPGIATRIADIETGRIVEPGKQGVLWIKGPNVMKGYLNQPQKTAEVIVDGWYNTGDIATVDEEGFITITDRLGRFSKIAGEMVSHTAIEEVCHKGLAAEDRLVAATSIPDEKKGEQIVVLYVESAMNGDRLFELLSQSELPNLAKPRRENLIGVEAIPILGSGKLDLQKIKLIASQAKGGSL